MASELQRDVQMTDLQEKAVNLRNIGRLTFPEIGKAMGISTQAAHTHYHAGRRHLEALAIPADSDAGSVARWEKREYIDNRLAMYDRIAREALGDEGKDPDDSEKTVKGFSKNSGRRVAIEALNGAYKYLELLIKIEGLEAPQKHEYTITQTLIEKEIAALEGKVQPDGSYTV
jgi:hypothetical protein